LATLCDGSAFASLDKRIINEITKKTKKIAARTLLVYTLRGIICIAIPPKISGARHTFVRQCLAHFNLL